MPAAEIEPGQSWRNGTGILQGFQEQGGVLGLVGQQALKIGGLGSRDKAGSRQGLRVERHLRAFEQEQLRHGIKRGIGGGSGGGQRGGYAQRQRRYGGPA